MDFREATDVLLEPFTISHLARALEVSEASVRQARLRNGKGVRHPPKGWEDRLISLAKERARVLLGTAEYIRKAVEVYDDGSRGASTSGRAGDGATAARARPKAQRPAGTDGDEALATGRERELDAARSQSVGAMALPAVSGYVTPFRGPITKESQTGKRRGKV